MTELDIEKIADLICKKITLSPRWLKLSAASQYVSVSKKRLVKLAEEKKVVGYQDRDSERGDWIFDRESLDEYRLSPVLQAESKISKIMRSL